MLGPMRKTFSAALLAAAALPAVATVTSSVSVSDSVSALVGSASDSLQRSSESSVGRRHAAAGEYRIVALADATGRPGRVQLTLRAAAIEGDHDDDRDEWLLLVPAPLVAQHALAAGETVTARPRPYGTEFAAGSPRQAFFLVLSDEWYRELDARPVGL